MNWNAESVGRSSGGRRGAATHLLADCAEDAGCHAADAVKHLEERDDGQDGGDKLDHLCRAPNPWSVLAILTGGVLVGHSPGSSLKRCAQDLRKIMNIALYSGVIAVTTSDVHRMIDSPPDQANR